MIQAQVTGFVALLLAAALLATLARGLPVPYLTLLAVLGAVASPLLAGHVPPLDGSLILFVVLPGLLFEAAFNLDWRHLRDNLLAVVLLATVGVAVTMAVVGALGHAALGLPLEAAVLFGAAVAATDPVAVVATFRRLRVPSRLANLVEAESLLNDGTGVVAFSIALSGLGLAAGTAPTVGSVLVDFVRLAFGGVALGLTLGFVLSRLIGYVDDPQVEMTLTMALAYGGYLLGEFLQVSGILCVVAAGIVVGNYGRPRGMSERTQQHVSVLWTYVAFLLNSAVFLLIGAEVPWSILLANLGVVAAGTLLVLIARAATVYTLLGLLHPLGRPIGWRWQHLLVWGGLRGTVAVALLLSLPTDDGVLVQVRAMVYGVVLTSILLQGATIGVVTRALLPWRHEERAG
ncbi:MAG TPA: sodium:proton antiporter [Candidatus Dormibacteraeota bacterium]|nr:sodium:proton antiporter [Candidatus Dormibacteraeota bacterium]